MTHKVWIVDIDDTLTVPYSQKLTTDAEWEAMCEKARPDVRLILRLVAARSPFDITVICTGRKEKNRAVTERWLRNNIPYQSLYMRQDDDNRSAVEVKRELFQQIKEAYDECAFALVDDDDDVRRMAWNELGIFALHPTTAALALVPFSEVPRVGIEQVQSYVIKQQTKESL